MANRTFPTPADLLVIALSPLLIMGMLGSLVFFAVDVVYEGIHEERLKYTLFFFVIAVVLIARIAIEVDRTRAALYGLGLGLAVWFALVAYVKFPPGSRLAPYSAYINFVLIGLVWWTANKLTWDCTYIDEKRRSSGKGLLSAVGADGDHGTSTRELKDADADVIQDVMVVDARPGEKGLTSWWRRYERYRKRQRKQPQSPGVTVLYFAMVALPIFGLGQSLIPVDDAARRSFAFQMMLLYVGSSLGLLLTTSFLGLRRYLRQRGLQMPLSMTGLWLMLGGGMIGFFLVVGAFLPRPHSETPLFDLQKWTSNDRRASSNAMLKDSSGKGEGASGNKSTAGQGKAVGKKGAPGGKGDSEGKKGSGGKGDDAGKSGDKSDQKSDDRPSEEEREAGENQRDAESDNEGQNEGNRSQKTSVPPVVEKLAGALKWIAFALVALLVIGLICWRGVAWLANFLPWAQRWLESIQNWWQSLFGKRLVIAEVQPESVREMPVERVPFTAFANPFQDGSARRRETSDLVFYTFAALEAWASEVGQERLAHETPLEFIQRLQETYPTLEAVAQKLGIVYARLAYAARNVADAQTRTILEAFWDQLGDTPREPVERVEVVG